MTRTDFDRILQHYGSQTPPPGLWPQSPLTPRELPVWFARLQRYAVARVLKALDDLSMQDRRTAPSLTAVLDTLRATPPDALPPPPWWSPDILAVVQQQGINGAFALLRAQQQDSDWRACHLAIQADDVHLPGREAAYLARCRQYAAQYPADRASWRAEIARVEARLQAEGLPPPRPTPPAQIGPFTHVSAPRHRRNADAHDR